MSIEFDTMHIYADHPKALTQHESSLVEQRICDSAISHDDLSRHHHPHPHHHQHHHLQQFKNDSEPNIPVSQVDLENNTELVTTCMNNDYKVTSDTVINSINNSNNDNNEATLSESNNQLFNHTHSIYGTHKSSATIQYPLTLGYGDELCRNNTNENIGYLPIEYQFHASTQQNLNDQITYPTNQQAQQYQQQRQLQLLPHQHHHHPQQFSIPHQHLQQLQQQYYSTNLHNSNPQFQFSQRHQSQLPKTVIVQSAMNNPFEQNQDYTKPIDSFDKCPTVCSLFAVLCCPITLGCSLPALAYSLCAYTDYRAMDMHRYRHKSDIARHLVITACVVGLLLCVTWVVLAFFYYEFMLITFNDILRVINHRLLTGT